MNPPRSYPLGDTVSGSPHSVVVSLPTMADVIGYEEKALRVLAAMQSGYPRFFEHPFIARLRELWQRDGSIPEGAAFLTANEVAAERLAAFAGGMPLGRGVKEGVGWVVYRESDDASRARARAFLQHTGSAPSSRQAEDLLVRAGQRAGGHTEDRVAMTEAEVVDELAPLFGVPTSHLMLARGGMNAFYAAFCAANRLLRPKGRRRWVQLGWLYVDTIKILQSMCEPGDEPIVWNDVFDLKGLARVLRPIRHEIAGIITEVPTNPLIQTPDVVALRALADDLGCLLVLDPSVASVANVDVSPWADIVVASLTKYTARAGDVLLGAVAVLPERRYGRALREAIAEERLAPYPGDLDRIGAQLAGWREFAWNGSRTCAEVAAFLEAHPRVGRVWWAGQAFSHEAYRRLARDRTPRWGSVLSFSLKGSLAGFYDAAEFAKGPSFGTEFSLMCPFMYLAHYDLVSTPEGRSRIEAAGISPDLIRFSIGSEPVATIIARLERALAQS